MNLDHLCEYHSLPGVAGGRLKGPMARTVSAFRRAMTAHRAVSSAGSQGAVMVWRDDAGQWRAQFMRNGVAFDATSSLRKSDILAWLREWLPEQHLKVLQTEEPRP